MRSFIPAHEIRTTLRRRIARGLAEPSQPERMPPDDPVLSDEAMLALMQAATIQHGRDFDGFSLAYAQRASDPALPDLQTLFDEGLVQRAGRKVFVPENLRREIMADTSARLQPLRGALQDAGKSVVNFSDAVLNDPVLAPVIAKITSPYDLHGVTCPRPDWVAARLWEVSRGDGTTASRLERWLDQWSLLQATGPVVRLVPRYIWAREDRLEFWAMAVEMLCGASSLAGWAEAYALFVRAATALAGGVIAEVPNLPDNLLDRVDWLNGYRNENLVFQCFVHGDLAGLAGILFEDLAASDHLGPVEALATRLLAKVAGAPELMERMSNAIERHPALLADLATHPELSGIAALLTARRRSLYQLRQEARDVQAENKGRGEAFQDVLDVVVARVSAGGAAAADLAVLFDDVVQTASHYRADINARVQPLLSAVMEAISGLEPEVLGTMLEMLVARLPTTRFPVTRLTPILDLIALGVVPTKASADAIVDYYASAIGPRSLVPHVAGMGAAACRALWDLAMADSQRIAKLNAPTDGRAYLTRARTVEDNEHSAARRFAEALRIHIRVLARAVQADPDVPPALADALVRSVRNATRADWPKGRVAGFSPDLEHSVVGPRDDKPLSRDLAAALGALGRADRQDLIEAIAETDEPTILAEIVSQAPKDVVEPLVRRLKALGPSDAAEIWTVTSAQARVQALLAAELSDAAAEYMAEEENLKSWGKVSGRDLSTFNARLRLAAIKRDWDQLQAMTAPEGLNQLDAAAANESLQFHQGLAAYAQPDGKGMARAEGLFERLWREHPHVAAYGVNLMAARASQVLSPDLFVRLKGEPLRKARAVLSASAAIPDGGSNNQRILGQNRALLLLATGAPQKALEALAQVGCDQPDSRDAAFRAVAFNRLGDGHQALAVLDAATQQFGSHEVLIAARRHILDNAPYDAAASTMLTDDQMVSVRSALTALRALSLDHQAGAVGHVADIALLVRDQVLQVAGSLIRVAPEMANLGMDKEDNITGVVRALLTARVHFLGWSVPDQSRGGRTAKRNPGERDLVLCRDDTEIAIIEAVPCRDGAHTETARKDLTQHFQKLFAYSPCGLYVHLTYGLIDDPADILPLLQDIAEKDAPPGYNFTRRECLGTTGGPRGFVASYAHAGGEAKVIFVFVDLKQEALVAAATLATQTKNGGKKAGSNPPTPGGAPSLDT